MRHKCLCTLRCQKINKRGGGGRNKRSWLFKKSKINKRPPPRLLGTVEYVNLYRNQVSPAGFGSHFYNIYDLPRIRVGNL